MNNRFFIMLIIALTLAGGAAWIAKTWVDNINGQKIEQNVVPIAAAAIDISYGAKIDAAQVKMLNWPKDSVPKGAFTDAKLVVGKIAQRAFVTDEALLEPQIKDKAAGSILSALIAEGKRAMSLRVDDVAGVAGFITPGNMVDIIATKNSKTYILLSNVKVLAIDQLAATEQDKPAVARALTVEVSFQESTLLVKAMRDGPLYFTLRNPIDKQNTAGEPATEATESTAQVSTSVAQPVKPRMTIIDWPTSGRRQEETTEGAR